MVTSLNGKSTKGSSFSPSSWASAEDQQFFGSLIAKHSLIVMGRKTYEAARPKMKLELGKRRVVVTRVPEKFSEYRVEGQLEFTKESVVSLVKRMDALGYKTMLLAGGSDLNSAFFREGLVDQLWLTIEPLIFPEGKGIIYDERLEVSLELLSMKKLNRNGTLLLRYKIKK